MLRILTHEQCRVCARPFDLGGGPLFLRFRHEQWLSRRARRHLLPLVCDGCWEDLDEWQRKKQAQANRRANSNTKYNRVGDAERVFWLAAYDYGTYSSAARDEWLAEKLTISAKALRNELAARAKAETERREEQSARHWSFAKSARRAMARAAPDAPGKHQAVGNQ